MASSHSSLEVPGGQFLELLGRDILGIDQHKLKPNADMVSADIGDTRPHVEKEFTKDALLSMPNKLLSHYFRFRAGNLSVQATSLLSPRCHKLAYQQALAGMIRSCAGNLLVSPHKTHDCLQYTSSCKAIYPKTKTQTPHEHDHTGSCRILQRVQSYWKVKY